ncbi:MAG: hypothetical protein FWE43_04765 [Streptococcaceae bacterium]|nr:hypothetical protein [Streptococcaceae bacterium]MCL2681782.1 hypothetical protein [Streptococcaceae bacterium]
MKKEEWTKNFEQLMGREPNSREIDEAKQNELFELESTVNEQAKHEWFKHFEQLMGRNPSEKEVSEAEQNGLFDKIKDESGVELVNHEPAKVKWTLPLTFTFYNSIWRQSKKQRITLYDNGLENLHDGIKISFDQLKEILVTRFTTQEFAEVKGTEHEVPDTARNIRNHIEDQAADLVNLLKGGGQRVADQREKVMKIIREKEDILVMNYKLSFMVDSEVAHWFDEGVDIKRQSILDFLIVKGESDEDFDKLEGIQKLVWDSKSVEVRDVNGQKEMISIQDMIELIQYEFESSKELKYEQNQDIKDVTGG